MVRRLVALAAVVALTLTGCASMSTPLPTSPASSGQREAAPVTPSPVVAPLAPSLRVLDYTTPPTVTGAWPPSCRVRGKLPDPRCTPGSVGPRTTAQVCVVGFEVKVRPIGAERAKTAAMRVYRVPATARATTELDHLVPLSLGGSNDVTNLWPEASDIAGAGFRNTKDGVEARVLAAVCRPRMGAKPVNLPAAQAAIARDWTTALAVLGVR